MAKKRQHLLPTKRRLVLIFFFVLLITISLISRLGYIQLVMGEELHEKAWEQWNRSIPTGSPRGEILDRNGELLVGSVTADSLIAIPQQIENPQLLSERLAAILDRDQEELFEKLTEDTEQVIVERILDKEDSRKVKALGDPGLKTTSETERYYPHGRLASQVLGFVGVDQGWAGIEYQYDEELKGQEGWLIFQADARQQELPHGVQQFVPPKDGQKLQTTLDSRIQYIMERELERAMVEYKPEGAMAVAMEPNTGEILGMASKPDYYPGEYKDFDESLRRITPINNTFEPGSTFKPVTLSAAIEEGKYNPDEAFYCPGHIEVSGAEIGCWTGDGHGAIDFTEVVYGSCNPGFVTLGQRLGTETLFDYIQGYGFGSRTGIDLPGETLGLLFGPDQVGPVELATTSFGQGISVTPIQQVVAVSAIANGGYINEPRIADKFLDEEGNVVKDKEVNTVRRAISEKTSQEVSEIMRGVVNEGSGQNAAIDGYEIAGKTGTAEKVGPEGGYVPGELIVSFVGFAPADDPEILIYVAVDTPTEGPAWGSQVAAPVFRNMMVDILDYLEVPPSKPGEIEEEVNYVEVPNLLNMEFEEAEEHIDQTALEVELIGDGETITDQIPEPGEQVPEQSSLILYLEATEDREEETVTVPDLRGRSMRETGEVLNMMGLELREEGSGIAVTQNPEKGTKVDKGTSVTVQFEPPDEFNEE
ncbi:penicillin-binding transpeptidase domain-containing protein [Natranaerobius thermophilus]|uniref:penicillin-binding transpeptidase domain-containing protein n=1 Tax=Natranaerobius thermophilus TaxID=375929 RepID=UPI002F41E67F